MIQEKWQTKKRMDEYNPNHFHTIIQIVGATLVVAQETVAQETVAQKIDTVDDKNGQAQGIAPTGTKTVGDMMGAFQSIVTVEYIGGVKRLGWQPFNGKLWLRNNMNISFVMNNLINEFPITKSTIQIIGRVINFTTSKTQRAGLNQLVEIKEK